MDRAAHEVDAASCAAPVASAPEMVGHTSRIVALACAYAAAEQAVIDHYSRTGLFSSEGAYDAAEKADRDEWRRLAKIRNDAHEAMKLACAAYAATLPEVR